MEPLALHGFDRVSKEILHHADLTSFHESVHLLPACVTAMGDRVFCLFSFGLPLPSQLFGFVDLVRVHPFGERIPQPGPGLHSVC